MAAYVNDTWDLNDKFTLIAGARVSNVALESKIDSTDLNVAVVSGVDTSNVYFLNGTTIKQNNTALTGQLGLVFHPGHGWKVSLLGGTAFRAPNVDDTGKLFDPPGGGILLPNPGLKPESSVNVDLGVSKQLKEKLFVQATGFYSLVNNLITTDKSSLVAPNGLAYDDVLLTPLTNVNKDKAYIYGVSAQMNIQLTHWMSLSSAINYTKGRIKTDSTDQPLDHVAPVFGKTSLQIQKKSVRAEFWAMYNGWKRIKDYRLNAEDNEIYATADGMPSWYTLNVRVQYQFARNFQVQVACENLLNMHYRVFASGTSGAGRNLMVTLRANF
jgi:hemoglobin/transferrin/lactoferrin receptor protein